MICFIFLFLLIQFCCVFCVDPDDFAGLPILRGRKDDPNKSKSRARIVCKGKVQDVFYRAYAKQQAGELGLTGYVRNDPNGSVELVLEGDTHRIELMYEWCKHGSPHARVDICEMHKTPFQGTFNEMTIIYAE